LAKKHRQLFITYAEKYDVGPEDLSALAAAAAVEVAAAGAGSLVVGEAGGAGMVSWGWGGVE